MTEPLDNFNNAQIKLSNDDDVQKTQQQSSSFFNTLKGYVKLNSSDPDNSNENDPFFMPSTSTTETSVLKKLQNVFQVEQSYTKFLIVLFVGLCLLFLSLMFLKNLGSIILIAVMAAIIF